MEKVLKLCLHFHSKSYIFLKVAFTGKQITTKKKIFPSISKQSTHTVENRVNTSGIHYASLIRKLKTRKK